MTKSIEGIKKLLVNLKWKWRLRRLPTESDILEHEMMCLRFRLNCMRSESMSPIIHYLDQ